MRLLENIVVRNKVGNKFHLFLYLTLLVGIAIRLYAYVYNPSFWFDEARTGAYLEGYIKWTSAITWSKLLLELQQIIAFMSTSEYFLRFPVLLANILTIFCVYKLFSSWRGKTFGLASAALFTVIPEVTQFAVEYKQYSYDLVIVWGYILFAHIILTYTNMLVREKNQNNRKYTILLTTFVLINVIAPALSYAVIFLIPGVTLWSIFQYYKRRDVQFLMITGATLFAYGSFFLVYFLFIRTSLATEWLVEYWKYYYAPLNGEIFGWGIRMVISYFYKMLALPTPIWLLVFLLFLCGVLRTIKQRYYQQLLWLLTPFALLFIASALQKYPFSGRAVLFMMPVLSYFIYEGFKVFAIKKYYYLKNILFVALLILSSFTTVNYLHSEIFPRQHIRPLLEKASQEWESHESVIVHGHANYQWWYYSSRFNPPQNISIIKRKESLFESTISNISTNTWIVWSHIGPADARNYSTILRKHGEIIKSYTHQDIQTTQVLYFVPNSRQEIIEQ